MVISILALYFYSFYNMQYKYFNNKKIIIYHYQHIMKYFKKIDIFAHPYQLKFKNKEHFTTTLGGIFTLIIIGLAIAVALSSGDQIYKRSKPQVNRNLIYQLSADNVTLTDFLPFYFYLETDKMYDKTISTISLKLYRRFQKYNNETKEYKATSERVDIDYEKCGDNLESNLNRFNNISKTNFTTTLLANNFKDSICIKDSKKNRELVIGGEYSSNYFGSLYIDIEKCSNSTTTDANNDSVICSSNEVIDSTFKAINLKFNFLQYFANTDDYDNPFYIQHTNTYIKLDTNFFYQANTYFLPLKITSDVGLLFTDEISEVKFTMDTFISYATFLPANNLLVRWYVQFSNKIDSYTRYYMKLQELAALVGGITNVLMVISYFVTAIFNKYFLEMMMINTFFNYTFHNENRVGYNSYNKYSNFIDYNLNDSDSQSNNSSSINNHNKKELNDNDMNKGIEIRQKIDLNSIKKKKNKNKTERSKEKRNTGYMDKIRKLSLSFDNNIDENDLKRRISLFPTIQGVSNLQYFQQKILNNNKNCMENKGVIRNKSSGKTNNINKSEKVSTMYLNELSNNNVNSKVENINVISVFHHNQQKKKSSLIFDNANNNIRVSNEIILDKRNSNNACSNSSNSLPSINHINNSQNNLLLENNKKDLKSNELNVISESRNRNDICINKSPVNDNNEININHNLIDKIMLNKNQINNTINNISSYPNNNINNIERKENEYHIRNNKNIITYNNNMNINMNNPNNSYNIKYTNLLTLKKSIFEQMNQMGDSIKKKNNNKNNEFSQTSPNKLLKASTYVRSKINKNGNDSSNDTSNCKYKENDYFYTLTYSEVTGIILCPCFNNYSRKKKYHKLLNSYLLTICDYEEIVTESAIFKELRQLGYFDLEYLNNKLNRKNLNKTELLEDYNNNFSLNGFGSFDRSRVNHKNCNNEFVNSSSFKNQSDNKIKKINDDEN